MSTNFLTSPIAGGRLDSTQTISSTSDGVPFPRVALGTPGFGEDGSRWMFVVATSAGLTAGDCVVIDQTFKAAPITKTLADKRLTIGVTPIAFSGSDYGWVCVGNGGKNVKVRCAAGVAANAKLYTSGTGGVLDDTATSAQTNVVGITVGTATTSAAGTRTAIMTVPHVV